MSSPRPPLPPYLAADRKSSRNRNITTPVRYTRNHVLEAPRRSRGGSGSGLFDRFDPSIDIAISAKTRSPAPAPSVSTLAEESSEPAKEPKQAPSTLHPSTSPRKRKQSPTVDENDKENQNPNLTSPSAPLRETWGNREGYVDASSLRTLETTPKGSRTRLVTDTPRAREFIPSMRATLTITTPSGDKKIIDVEFFQLAQTADDTEEVTSTPEAEVNKIKKEKARPVSDKFEIKDAKITAESIKKQKERRTKTDKEPAKKLAAVGGKQVRADHSHAYQHSLGIIFAKSVLTEEDKKAEKKEEQRLTFPAHRRHNSMRLAGPEVPGMRVLIQSRNHLYYSNEIELFRDENGPICLLKEERASWRDEQGNMVQFHFSPWNGVKPAKGARVYSHDLLKFTLSSPPRKKEKESDEHTKGSANHKDRGEEGEQEAVATPETPKKKIGHR